MTDARTTTRDEIAALHELDQRRLVARFEELFGRPPRSKNRAWLIKRCAHQVQVARCGGLSEAARKRLAEIMAEIDLPTDAPRTVNGSVAVTHRPGTPPVGTTLVREWHGRQIRVTVVETGFDHDGVVHRSLSAVAKAVTGTHWDGRLFFGLKNRRKGA